MKVGDLIRLRGGKMVLILEELINKDGNKRFITLIDGEKHNQPATLLNVFGKVVSENTSH
jgi:hypothetical protein